MIEQMRDTTSMATIEEEVFDRTLTTCEDKMGRNVARMNREYEMELQRLQHRINLIIRDMNKVGQVAAGVSAHR